MSIMIIYNKKAPIIPSYFFRMLIEMLKPFVRNPIIWKAGFGNSHFPVILGEILELILKNNLSGENKE